MINYQFFPRSHGLTKEMEQIDDCFKIVDAAKAANSQLRSNDMLGLVRPHLEKVKTFLETLYVSNRIRLPLKGILPIGY